MVQLQACYSSFSWVCLHRWYLGQPWSECDAALTEICNLPFLRLMINHNYPGIHPDWIKQICFKKLVTLRIIHD